MTGESVPVAKRAGDAVLAGTVNGEGAIEIEVTRTAADSTIARIARLVEAAQAARSPAERFIDRFARWYTPAVVLLACALVLVPVLAFGQPLLDSADGRHGWLYRGLALLIVACPCALVISIPVTVVSSLTRLAQLGVLVKGGERLDALADVRVIAFDKTGTLTVGRPAVTCRDAVARARRGGQRLRCLRDDAGVTHRWSPHRSIPSRMRRAAAARGGHGSRRRAQRAIAGAASGTSAAAYRRRQRASSPPVSMRGRCRRGSTTPAVARNARPCTCRAASASSG